MTPETYIPDPTRWTNNPNDVVALLSIIIVLLIVYIVWDRILVNKERKEVNQALKDNTEVLNKIYGALDDHKHNS